MVKNIDRTEISTTEIKKLFQELEKCRNQDNNPDSQAYKRKIQVKLSLGSSTYIYINQNSFPDSNQIYLVTLRPRQLTQASFLQKNQTL